jgi:hypothetical protein
MEGKKDLLIIEPVTSKSKMGAVLLEHGIAFI